MQIFTILAIFSIFVSLYLNPLIASTTYWICSGEYTHSTTWYPPFFATPLNTIRFASDSCFRYRCVVLRLRPRRATNCGVFTPGLAVIVSNSRCSKSSAFGVGSVAWNRRRMSSCVMITRSAIKLSNTSGSLCPASSAATYSDRVMAGIIAIYTAILLFYHRHSIFYTASSRCKITTN